MLVSRIIVNIDNYDHFDRLNCTIFRILEHSIGAANLRERTRMRVLSKAFGKLKLMLPWVPPDTKLSKLDTLRLATSYISHLQKILDDNGGDFNDSNTENSLKNYNNASLVSFSF